jgi:hypothetical protein
MSKIILIYKYPLFYPPLESIAFSCADGSIQVDATNYNWGRSRKLPASNGLEPIGRQVVKEITEDLRCLSSLNTRGRRLKLAELLWQKSVESSFSRQGLQIQSALVVIEIHIMLSRRESISYGVVGYAQIVQGGVCADAEG